MSTSGTAGSAPCPPRPAADITPIFAAWIVEVGIIAVRDLTTAKRLPLPSELLATFVVFGGLGLVAESGTFRGAANATAWGIVVATFLSSKVDFLAPVGAFFAPSGTGLNQAAVPALAGQMPQLPLTQKVG